MRKISLAFFICCTLGAAAQKSVEVGIMLGASNYDGDLVATPFQRYHPAGGLIGRFNLNDFFSVKGNVFYGTLSGADSTSPDEWKQNRNLSFKSPIFEFSAQLEYNLFGYNPDGVRGKGRSRAFSPYVFAGIGIFKYNPMAYHNEEWVELQPLGTEGQGTTQFQDRKKYDLTQVSVPVGMGLKIRIAQKWTLGFEYGTRITFDDYIDDVSSTYVDPQILGAAFGGQASNSVVLADRSPNPSEKQYNPQTYVGPQRGNPNDDDWYAYTGITLTYSIFGNRVKCYSF